MRTLKSMGYFISTLMIYLVIPLVGWGITDLDGFFAEGPRLAYALIILIVGIGIGWQASVSPKGFRGGDGKEDKLVLRQRIIRIVVTLLLYVALLFLPLADRRDIGTLPDHPTIRWFGVFLFGLGIGLVYWSGVALGRLYSGDVTLQEDHHLITTGPYRWIRHPRYIGAILLGFGLATTFNSWIGLVTSVVLVPIILFRIRDEEVLMKESFGEEWEQYCEQTHRLIPFIY